MNRCHSNQNKLHHNSSVVAGLHHPRLLSLVSVNRNESTKSLRVSMKQTVFWRQNHKRPISVLRKPHLCLRFQGFLIRTEQPKRDKCSLRKQIQCRLQVNICPGPRTSTSSIFQPRVGVPLRLLLKNYGKDLLTLQSSRPSSCVLLTQK